MKIESTIEIDYYLSNFFADLAHMKGSRFFLVDDDISSLPVDCSLWKNNGQNSLSLILLGANFTLSVIRTDNRYLGMLRMDYDFGLSLESCMRLYNYNIDIEYVLEDMVEAKVYDRVSIERNFAIKNIIDYDEQHRD